MIFQMRFIIGYSTINTVQLRPWVWVKVLMTMLLFCRYRIDNRIIYEPGVALACIRGISFWLTFGTQIRGSPGYLDLLQAAPAVGTRVSFFSVRNDVTAGKSG